VKVSEFAKVKIGNEYFAQNVLSGRDKAATINKVGGLEAQGILVAFSPPL
jgi:hypothetical protein